MKRIPVAARALPRSHSSVVAGLLTGQIDHYGRRAARNNVSRLAATGIEAYLYQNHRLGEPCSCGITSYQTALDDEGHLRPDAMRSIARRVGQRDRGVEVFNASEFSVTIDDTTLDEPGATRIGQVSALDTVDLLGLEETRCGLCMGTGFRGGYTLANGYRECLVPETADTDHVIDRSERPFLARGGTYAEWSVTLPAYRRYVYRLWQQDTVVAELEPAVEPTLGVSGTIRFEIDREWSHIEVISRGSAVVADISTSSIDDADPLTLAEITIHLASNYNVPVFSLVAETKYNSIWQIKSITPVRDTQNVVIYQECLARRVKPNEIYRKLVGVLP